MRYADFLQELNLDHPAIAVTRLPSAPEEGDRISAHCVFSGLKKVWQGETLILTEDFCGCRGFSSNTGFSLEKPPIPGGYDQFLSTGAGEGFRPGERIKADPETADAFFHSLPDLPGGPVKSLRLEPYADSLAPDVVLLFATVDQLSGLTYLHDFRKTGHDNIIVATTAGCASIFRIPLAEAKKETPKAVLGSLDMASRPYTDRELLSFAVTGLVFKQMLADGDHCFFRSPMWQPLQKRLHT